MRHFLIPTSYSRTLFPVIAPLSVRFRTVLPFPDTSFDLPGYVLLGYEAIAKHTLPTIW
jgi:hypothetical protein